MGSVLHFRKLCHSVENGSEEGSFVTLSCPCLTKEGGCAPLF